MATTVFLLCSTIGTTRVPSSILAVFDTPEPAIESVKRTYISGTYDEGTKITWHDLEPEQGLRCIRIVVNSPRYGIRGFIVLEVKPMTDPVVIAL